VLRDTKGQSLLTALFRKADDQIRIVNIDSNALAEQFEKLLKNIHQLSRRMLEHNTGRVIVRDACRWSSTCPARTAKRFIVRKGCSVSCCFHGKSLGKLGDPTSTLQKNYNRHLKATQKKRGCATCPVRDKCSQCPFLGHMHARVFCSLKRKDNERIAAFISLLELRIGSLPAA
jgi:hypothetical protein